MTTQVSAQQTLVDITSPHFAKGYRLGRIWFFHGEAELPLDDTYLVEMWHTIVRKGYTMPLHGYLNG